MYVVFGQVPFYCSLRDGRGMHSGHRLAARFSLAALFVYREWGRHRLVVAHFVFWFWRRKCPHTFGSSGREMGSSHGSKYQYIELQSHGKGFTSTT